MLPELCNRSALLRHLATFRLVFGESLRVCVFRVLFAEAVL